jgi:hypothetical protein
MAQQASAPRTQLPAVIKYDGDMAVMLAQLPEIYGVTIGVITATKSRVDCQNKVSRTTTYCMFSSVKQLAALRPRSINSYG